MGDWSYRHLALLIAAAMIWCKTHYSSDDDDDDDFEIENSARIAKKLWEEVIKS